MKFERGSVESSRFAGAVQTWARGSLFFARRGWIDGMVCIVGWTVRFFEMRMRGRDSFFLSVVLLLTAPGAYNGSARLCINLISVIEYIGMKWSKLKWKVAGSAL